MEGKKKDIEYDAIRQELGEEDIFFSDHPEIHVLVDGKSKEEKLKIINKKMDEWECIGWANLDMALRGCHMEGKMKIENM